MEDEISVPRRMGDYRFSETTARFYPENVNHDELGIDSYENGAAPNQREKVSKKKKKIQPCFMSSKIASTHDPSIAKKRRKNAGYACPIFMPYKQLGNVDLQLGSRGGHQQRRKAGNRNNSSSQAGKSISEKIMRSQRLFLGDESEGTGIIETNKQGLRTQLGRFKSGPWRKNRIVYTKRKAVDGVFRKELLHAHRRVKISKANAFLGTLSAHMKPPTTAKPHRLTPRYVQVECNDEFDSDEEDGMGKIDGGDGDHSKPTLNVPTLKFDDSHAQELRNGHLEDDLLAEEERKPLGGNGNDYEVGHHAVKFYLPYDTRKLSQRPVRVLDLQEYQEVLNKKGIKKTSMLTVDNPIELHRQKTENMWAAINMEDILNFLKSDEYIGNLIGKAHVKVSKSRKEREKVRKEFQEEFGNDALVQLILNEFGKNATERSRKKIDILSLFFDSKYANVPLTAEEKAEKRKKLVKKYERFAIDDLKARIQNLASRAPKNFRNKVRKIILERSPLRKSNALSALRNIIRPKSKSERNNIRVAVLKNAPKNTDQRENVRKRFIKQFEKNTFKDFVKKEFGNDTSELAKSKPDLLSMYFSANASIAPNTYEGRERVRKILIKEFERNYLSEFNRVMVDILKKHVTLELNYVKKLGSDGNDRPPTPGLPSDRMSRPTEKLREAADGFAGVRKEMDQILASTLHILNVSRGETLRRKYEQISGGFKGINWQDEISLMRLGSELTRLEDNVLLHEHTKWFYNLLRDYLAHKEYIREQTFSKLETFILTFIHKVLDHNHLFDGTKFILMCQVLKKEELSAPEVQSLFRFIRKHSDHISEKTFLNLILERK